ncbi:DNA-binding SARP family transcriptional activator [Streptomyces sp. V3I8]|uniref:AfsR/SARP family transcriptional regulator n=1 Tax=Streptomyces sp. V3I8 TaxID=3042279 RepID=UPI0027801927|nr:BTAD domain-containing putative transcriptional regulator [Streptomyces sp. V3I8]MDQ1039029.1 DNA-binding SARP family transcriptional activator [Streptomyces sp. V3I8]
MSAEHEPTAGIALRFSVLGPLRAWRRATELSPGPPKQRSVLALLLVQAGRPVPLEQILDALWDDDPPDHAVNVVHRHVGSLRRLLEPELTQRAAARVLVRAGGGYRLNVADEALDLLEFRKLREAAHTAATAGRPAQATGLFVRALSLWRGRTAADLPRTARSHPVFAGVDAEYLHAAGDAADAALAAGRTYRVLPLLRQAAESDPLNEHLQARLVLVLAAEGQSAQALEHYQAVRSRLASELGVDPGAELRDAQIRVLRGTVAPTTGARSGAAVVPAAATTGAEAFPGVRPAQLPADLHAFTGRRTELEWLRGLLPADGGPPEAAVVSAIVGAPGVGKTTLALHWAHRNAHRFPDGQLYVNLRGYDLAGAALAPSAAIRCFLEALGVPAENIPPTLDGQTVLYRSLLARRRILVVLDNARSAEQVRPLLPGTPTCLTVITSREQMPGLVASHGARSLRLDLLTVTESLEFMSKRLGAARVEADGQAALGIAEQCGRLPLALAIVCARTESRAAVPLADIAAELAESRDDLGVFAVGDPATDPRSVFSWSYRTLTPAAAGAFRLLWMCPPHGVSPQAVASLTGRTARETGPVLCELTRASLWSEPAPGLYSSHELLRTFAQELSLAEDAPDAREDARRRLFDHYLHSARGAATRLYTHREPLTLPPAAAGTQVVEFTGTDGAAKWLAREMPALEAVITRDSGHGTGAHAWRMAATLELVLDRRGRREEIELHTAALAGAQRLGETQGEAHMHRVLGFAHVRTNDHVRGAWHLEKALELFTAMGDVPYTALTHRYLAFLANTRQDHREALAQYKIACALYTSTRAYVGIASVTNEVAWTRLLLHEYEEALGDCHRAVRIAARSGNRNIEAAAWDTMGVAHHRLGRPDEALEAFDRALAHYRALNDASLTADTLIHRGEALAATSPREARQAWDEALRILDALGHTDAGTLRELLEGRGGDAKGGRVAVRTPHTG